MKHKILIVDSESAFVEKVKAVLSGHNYAVFASSDYKSGFETLKKIAPDILIVSISPLGAEGRTDALKSILQYTGINGIPIVLVVPDKEEKLFTENLEPLLEKLSMKTVVSRGQIEELLSKHVKELAKEAGEQHRKIVAEVEFLIEKWSNRRGSLIMILHEIQNEFGYVPRSVAFILSQRLNISLARIYEVITFYNFFRLEAPGKHIISVCMGTACYLKGAGKVLEELKNILNVEEGQTTEDGLFYLQVVRCLGCCGLAPVFTIDEKVYGNVQREKIVDILSGYAKKGELDNAKTNKR